MNEPKSLNPKHKIPWKTGGLVGVLILGIVVMQSQATWFNETFNLSRDRLNAYCLLVGFVAFLAIGGWWFLFSGYSRLLRFVTFLVLIGLGVAANRTVRLIPGGDIGIRRVEFVFWERELTAETPSEEADLATPTAGDFPGFLGPDGTATVDRIQLEPWQNASPRELWRQDIGKGWSGFSAVNGFAVTMEQRQEFECVTCYEIRTGQLKWIHRDPVRHEDMMGLGGVGPRSTPAIDKGRVYVQGATGTLKCLDGRKGEVIWSVHLPDLIGIELSINTDTAGYKYAYEKSNLAWGRSASPLIVDDLVVIPGGGPLGGPYVTLFAFDKLTGEEVWRGGEQMISYGSPSLATLRGQRQILIVGESVSSGHHPETGEVFWQHARPGSSSADANCSQVTPVNDRQVLLTKGYRAGGELVELTVEDGEWKTERVWKNNRVLKTKMNSPVLRDGFAYSLSAGYLECVDTQTGQQQWIHPNRKSKSEQDSFDHGQFLLVGDHLVVQSEKGVLYLVKASPDSYQRIGKLKSIDGVCWNTLCLYDRYLIVRSDLEAALFRTRRGPRGDRQHSASWPGCGSPG